MLLLCVCCFMSIAMCWYNAWKHDSTVLLVIWYGVKSLVYVCMIIAETSSIFHQYQPFINVPQFVWFFIFFYFEILYFVYTCVVMQIIWDIKWETAVGLVMGKNIMILPTTWFPNFGNQFFCLLCAEKYVEIGVLYFCIILSCWQNIANKKK